MRKNISATATCIAALIVLCLTPSGASAPSIKDTWSKILKKCAKAAPIGNDTVFLGPSNDVGPGSVWRIANDHSLRLVWDLADAEPNAAKREALLKSNPPATCTGNAAASWDLSLGLPFVSKIVGLSVGPEADLKKARSVKVSIDKWAIVELKEGPFKRLLESPDLQNQQYRRDLLNRDYVFIENAILVSGFNAQLEFSKDDALTLKAKYSSQNLSTSDEGIKLGAAWKSDTTLSLTTTQPFYLIANYAQWNGTRIVGLGGQPVLWSPVKVAPSVDLGTERNRR